MRPVTIEDGRVVEHRPEPPFVQGVKALEMDERAHIQLVSGTTCGITPRHWLRRYEVTLQSLESRLAAAETALADRDRHFMWDDRLRMERELGDLATRLATAEAELEQLRGVAWALADTLGKRCLADANAERESPNDWPAGQSWNDLVGTSHSIMRRRGYAEAGLDAKAVIALLCDKYGNAKEFRAPSTGGTP